LQRDYRYDSVPNCCVFPERNPGICEPNSACDQETKAAYCALDLHYDVTRTPKITLSRSS
jgi:hypothetical protein